jgi:opacity protein-like surface antigen
VPAGPAAASTIELTGYVGLLLPMSKLGSQGDSIQAELSTQPSFAAGLDVWFGGGFGLGLMGGYANPNVGLTSVDSGSGVQQQLDLGNADYLHGEAVLQWRPALRGSASVLLPYFGAGAGVRRLSFEGDSGFEDQTDLTLVLNAGAQIQLSEAVHMRLDVRDLVSSFQSGPFESSDQQHDLFAQVGVGVAF